MSEFAGRAPELRRLFTGLSGDKSQRYWHQRPRITDHWAESVPCSHTASGRS